MLICNIVLCILHFQLPWPWLQSLTPLSRGAPRLEEVSEHGQTRASQHWSPEGKRIGERKRPTFHPPRSRIICVRQSKYRHCFKGNLGETAERWGGARTGLSERYDAILSWNWNVANLSGQNLMLMKQFKSRKSGIINQQGINSWFFFWFFFLMALPKPCRWHSFGRVLMDFAAR